MKGVAARGTQPETAAPLRVLGPLALPQTTPVVECSKRIRNFEEMNVMSVVAFFQYLFAHEPTADLAAQLAYVYTARTCTERQCNARRGALR